MSTKGSQKQKDSQSQTKLKEHQFIGKKLVPPFAQLNMTPASWIDDRLPEMLWAELFTVAFPREEALKRFEEIVDIACEVTDTQPQGWREHPLVVTLSGIAKLEETEQLRFMEAIAKDDESKQALVPMLFFDNLPAKKKWESVIKIVPTKEDTHKLVKAVAACFFHQSQEATDCRWVKALYAVKSGYVSFGPNVQETPRLILDYPKHNEEQMRRSRPSIRAMEINLDIRDSKYDWPENFWQECYDKTRCLPQNMSEEELKKRFPPHEQLAEDKKKLEEINQELTTHFWETEKGSKRDPKHEVAFGIALYAGDIATSNILMGMGRSSQGRMALRSLVDCLISLKYLAMKEDPTLWLAFRSHGTGQAKLVLQRAEEEERAPEYLDQENLGQIANDDAWVEFVTVDIGDWDDSGLRSRAIEVGLKDRYDDYYTWPSSYTHGQWGAIREAIYGLCGNPLHRFHRIPLLQPLTLKESREDIFLLLGDIVNLIYEIFPKDKQAKDESVKKPTQ